MGVLAAHPALALHTEVDGKRLYEHLFERARAPRPESEPSTPAFIRETIAKYLVASEAASARAGAP